MASGKRKRESFHIVGQVGQGTYGTCYEIQHDGRRMAMKLMICDTDRDFGWFFRTTIREMVFGRYEKVFVHNEGSTTHVGAFQELGRCTLLDVTVDEPCVRHLGYQIASQLYVLHLDGILHNDVKPDNILLMDNGSARLIDFSLSVRVPQSSDPDVVTIWYRAPEVCLGLVHTSKSDVWSLGVVLLNKSCSHVVIGRSSSISGMLDSLTSVVGTGGVKALEDCVGVRDSSLHTHVANAVLRDLLHNMLHPDPEKRYSMLDVLDHPFWQGPVAVVDLPSQTYMKRSTSDTLPPHIDVLHRSFVSPSKPTRDVARAMIDDMCDEFNLPRTVRAQCVRYFDQLPSHTNVRAMCIASVLGALATDSETVLDVDDLIHKFPTPVRDVTFSMHQLLYVAS